MAKIIKFILNVLKLCLKILGFIILLMILAIVFFHIFDDSEEKCMEQCLAEGHEKVDCANNRCDFPI